MSEFEYNNLLFEISQRLDNINVGKQLLVICRGKLAARRGEENIPTFSLFEELEEKGFLSSDRLSILKAMLKGVKEWAFLEEVEKFEYKKTEYNNLLEQIIRELDELNDLERLVSICCGKITEERQASIHDVRSLLKELESNGLLGIDSLRIMKEILTQTEKSDLLKEVEEFEQRQRRENKFERRKAQAAAIASSAIDKMAAVLNIKTVFKVVVGGFTMASSLELLIRDSTYDQLVAAINTCVLPAGAHLIQISEGCVCLKVHVESLATLENLWRLYKDGILKAKIQALLVTDEMRELAGGEQVEAIVTIDEQEYDKARNKLANEIQEDPDAKEERRLKYLDQEKYDYIQNYLEQSREHAKDLDAHSVMEESDSGKPGSSSVPSEVGTEETSGKGSVLSVILIVSSFKLSHTDGAKFMSLIGGCLREKLALIPDTKLVITNGFSSVMEKEEIPRETLQLYLPRRIVLATLLDLLNKRWQTMDLISVMLELKRTLSTGVETILPDDEDFNFLFFNNYSKAKMDENLSCLPRLQKTELIDGDK